MTFKRSRPLRPPVPKFESKLKLGRKLDDVDAATASDNQVSVLFRFDESGADRHVSFSVESDAMSADDVVALLAVLEQRGLFTKHNSKTWVSQPQASEARFGSTRAWQGVDVGKLADRLSAFWSTEGETAAPASDPAAAALARLREAERRVGELERALAALKAAVRGEEPPA